MRQSRMGAVANQFQRLYSGGSIVGLGEWELLRRYLDRGDEDAFRVIVASHGPMVMGVCRRILGEAVDVEDAFQVTFLILAKKASKLGPGDPVGHWLYGVAYRVALRARTAAARRQARERAVAGPEPATTDDLSGSEVARVIDEALARLPAKYRAPVVLCYLEGLTHDDAAQQLGWPVGTVKGRLSRARDLLKGRLSRRGMAPAEQASVMGLIQGARAFVPAPLADRTARAALAIAAGRTSGIVSASAALLFEEGVRTMFFHKLKFGVALLMVLGTSAAVVAYQGSKGPGDAAKPTPVEPASDPQKVAVTRKVATSEEYEGPLAAWPILVDRSLKTQAILAVLEKPLAIKFGTETPLEDIKKYIQDATSDETTGFPTGLPIYVDPQGLKDADKTLASTVICDLEGIPLKTTLRLMLKQLGLTYTVRDGLLTITHSLDNPSPIERVMEIEKRGELTREQYLQITEILKLRIELIKLEKELEKLEQGSGFQ